MTSAKRPANAIIAVYFHDKLDFNPVDMKAQ
jgi:hypothetical protein